MICGCNIRFFSPGFVNLAFYPVSVLSLCVSLCLVVVQLCEMTVFSGLGFTYSLQPELDPFHD